MTDERSQKKTIYDGPSEPVECGTKLSPPFPTAAESRRT